MIIKHVLKRVMLVFVAAAASVWGVNIVYQHCIVGPFFNKNCFKKTIKKAPDIPVITPAQEVIEKKYDKPEPLIIDESVSYFEQFPSLVDMNVYADIELPQQTIRMVSDEVTILPDNSSKADQETLDASSADGNNDYESEEGFNSFFAPKKRPKVSRGTCLVTPEYLYDGDEALYADNTRVQPDSYDHSSSDRLSYDSSHFSRPSSATKAHFGAQAGANMHTSGERASQSRPSAGDNPEHNYSFSSDNSSLVTDSKKDKKSTLAPYNKRPFSIKTADSGLPLTPSSHKSATPASGQSPHACPEQPLSTDPLDNNSAEHENEPEDELTFFEKAQHVFQNIIQMAGQTGPLLAVGNILKSVFNTVYDWWHKQAHQPQSAAGNGTVISSSPPVDPAVSSLANSQAQVAVSSNEGTPSI